MKLKKFREQFLPVPAQQGWFLCGPITEEDGSYKQLWREPIVAWVVDITTGRANDAEGEGFEFAVALPVVCSNHTDSDNPCILAPDGDYYFPFDVTVDTEERAIEVFVSRKSQR